MFAIALQRFALIISLLLFLFTANAQTSLSANFSNSIVCAGIEVGSKGVKMSVLELSKNVQKNSAFTILKDTSVNTDFISFTTPSFDATLNELFSLYKTALNKYSIAPEKIFTVISSGVKIQADKENKAAWVTALIDSFRIKANEPKRAVDVIDVTEEARLSHLGIVPDSRRYTTFLIDIGSGNTKGGYFYNGNTKDLKLFQLTWGTKSTANATEKRMEEDKTIGNYNRQLQRVLAGSLNEEVIYAVNASGAYNMSDYVAFSGGIAWSLATLMYPELTDNAVVPVTFPEVVDFYDKVLKNANAYSDSVIAKSLPATFPDKAIATREAKRVNSVFDQRSLLSGTGLLLKIMRQFEGIYEKKQFYLVKNGQVGWISAYVNQSLSK